MQIEAERYELTEEPSYSFVCDRRRFFEVLGAGIVVVGLIGRAEAQEAGRGGGPRRGRPELPREIGAWLHVREDGRISAFSGKAEVGQNTRTALTQGVAEELRVPADSVRLVMADTDLVPWDAGTFGSRSMPDMLPRLRNIAAHTRDLLLTRAAAKLGADRARLLVNGGRITDSVSGKSIAYGELAAGDSMLKIVPEGEPAVTPVEQWTDLGRSLPKVNGRDFVTGKHKFATDIVMPDMMYGAVVRPPSAGATMAGADTSTANGVVVVRDGTFLGVAARDAASARHAARAIKPEWKTTPQPSESELFRILRGAGPSRTESTKGSLEEGLAAADRKLSATYTVAYIAHAPLEPRAAVAHWQGDKLTVWTGTQRPFGVRSELAQAFGIPESRVRVIVPDTGSGYGGKHTGEAAVEAARLAKTAGKPVKLVWSREEEFAHAYFRPAGVIEVYSGVRNDGTLTAWDFHNYNSGGSAIATLYDVPHQRVHFHRADSPLRQGSYRALAATANHFAREVHMDEAAHAVSRDPLEFRLQNLRDARLRAVFERAADKFGYGKRKAGAGTGFGMGGGFEKGGYVASFAEVAADPDLKNVRVLRIVTAFECGAVVNPDALSNQIEGAVVQGLGGALTEAIHFENGRVLTTRFSQYHVPRFRDTPVIETVLVDRKDLPPAGAGETPIVGVAPAIGNAIFAATGKRLRSLPMLGA